MSLIGTEYIPYVASLIGAGLFVIGYWTGRNVGVDIGAGGMFDNLRDNGYITTVTMYNSDGNEVEELVPPK